MSEQQVTPAKRAAMLWLAWETGWFIGYLWRRRLDWWMWLIYGHRYGTAGELVP